MSKRQNNMKVKIKRLSKNAVIPKKAHATDAGMDMVAVSRDFDNHGNVVYGTGIAVEIPEGYVGLVFPRSSIHKRDLLLSNSVGVIDSGYRGEITFKFKMAGGKMYADMYGIGDRIGQLIIMPIPDIEFEETDELGDTDRGTGGYGSTGE